MRGKALFLRSKLKLASIVLGSCLGVALLVFGYFKIFAEPLGDDARVYENDQLTYYITVNSDGIDHEGVTSSDSQIADEVSGVTTVSDVLPEGLTFEGFVTSPDGTFGAVQRDDKTSQCSGRVIDDTNEDGVESGVWNADNTEYTYHGLHYDAATRKVTFRTKGIGAGCELTVGVITRTPYLGKYEYRKDFYDHASFVDESLFGNSNTVHAWIEKPRPVDDLDSEDTPKPDGTYYSLKYKLTGDIPQNPPALPAQEWHKSGEAITIAEIPAFDECYSFDGWWGDYTSYYSSSTKVDVSNLTTMPYFDVVIYGILTKTCSDGSGDEPAIEAPVKYDVSYEIDGTKPEDFKVPAKRSYYEGASVYVDSTNTEGDNIDGYDFSGWSTDDVDLGDETNFTMPKKNVLLRGSFEQQSYTVSYQFIGDVMPDNANSLLPASSEHYAGETVSVAAVPSADGYTFSGWYADPSFEMPAENVVIKGEWTKNKAEFVPGIVIEITNPESEYHKGDTVEFKITVSNDKDFALNNVWIKELLEGAIFIPGDGYEIEGDNFVSIATVPANSSASVYAKFDVVKNIEKIYTNTVEFVAADIENQDYVFPAEWDKTASVDFATGILADVPVDKDNEETKPDSPVTYDGLGKMMVSGATLAGGLGLCIVLSRRVRRGGIIYGYCAGIMVVSGLAVVLINGGGNLFADSLELRPSLDIRSEKANYDDGGAGAWNVNESAQWTGVGEATLKIKVNTKHIANLHKKDVILVVDNGVWTTKAIDGTPIDREDEPTTLDLMKNGMIDFVQELLADGDSNIVVIPTWGNYDNVMTRDVNTAISQIEAITSTDNVSYNNYSVSYSRVIDYLDHYAGDEDSRLNIVYVADDHYALSNDIAKYEMLREKAPDASISSIGFGFRELLGERYVSSASANDSGIVRFWVGVDGNMNALGYYNRAVNGLELISGYHENPFYSDLMASLIRCIDTSTMYDKFNLSTTINLEDFDIKGIYGNYGDIEVDNGVISWKNEGNNSFVSGANYEMSVLLKAKDSTVEKHKLYRLNTNTVIESDARDIEAENVTSNSSVVLMNGYEVTFNINNTGSCSLGDNQTKVYLAHQKLDLDESNVSCEGWNFDVFRDSNDGAAYSSMRSEMPAADLALKATWRKTNVEVHMDGAVYVVAPAILKKGIEFDESLRDIRQKAVGYSGGSALLKAENGCPSDVIDNAHRISDDDSPTAVYAWINNGSVEYDDYMAGSTGKIAYYNPFYYCTEAETIKLNEDSSRLFYYGSYNDEDGKYRDVIQYIKMVEGIEDWDASDVKSLDYAFAGNSDFSANNYTKIKDWDTSSVESMEGIFSGTYISGDVNPDALSGWDTSSVKSLKKAFESSSSAMVVIGGIKNWDVSNVEDMSGLATNVTSSLDNIANWDVSSVKNLDEAFRSTSSSSRANDYSFLANWGQKFTQLESLNNTFSSLYYSEGIDFSSISNWNVSTVKEMNKIFSNTYIKDLGVLSDWDVSGVEDLSYAFSGAKLNVANENVDKLNGIEDWDVRNVKNMAGVFSGTSITSLSAVRNWKTSNVEDLTDFASGTRVVDLSGLEDWDTSKVTTLMRAFHEDTGLRDLSAIAGWDVSNVESLAFTFKGISASDVKALKDWNVSGVKTMYGIFCGAYDPSTHTDCDDTFPIKDSLTSERGAYGGIASLEGVEEWDTSSVEDISDLIAGSRVTDLAPLRNWDVSKVSNMEGAFMHLNITTLEPLSDWDTSSLGSTVMNGNGLTWAFAFDKRLANLHGLENWNVSGVHYLTYTFAYMDALNDISALGDWDTPNLAGMEGTFKDHKNLTSLHGLENWDVSNLTDARLAFLGYSRYSWNYYTDWANYCNSALTDISALENWGSQVSSLYSMERMFAGNNRLTSLAPLNTWTVANKWIRMNGTFEGNRSVTSLSGLENFFKSGVGSSPQFSYAFMNMTGLTDVSALADWVDDSATYVYIDSMFRNDRNITSLTSLENTFLKNAGAYAKNNTFDNIPASVARPSWY